MSIEITGDSSIFGPSDRAVDWADMDDDSLLARVMQGVPEAQKEFERRMLAETAKKKANDAEIVKVRRRALDVALAQLDEMPRDDEGMIAVPWPVQPREQVPVDDWAWSNLQAFVIEDLTATQATLDPATLRRHLENLSNVREGQSSYPNIVRRSDATLLIHDGHHRLAALWLIGAIVSNCWMLEVEA